MGDRGAESRKRISGPLGWRKSRGRRLQGPTWPSGHTPSWAGPWGVAIEGARAGLIVAALRSLFDRHHSSLEYSDHTGDALSRSLFATRLWYRTARTRCPTCCSARTSRPACPFASIPRPSSPRPRRRGSRSGLEYVSKTDRANAPDRCAGHNGGGRSRPRAVVHHGDELMVDGLIEERRRMRLNG